MTYETSGPYVAVKRAIDESGHGMITGWPKITIKAVDAKLLLMRISLLERQAVELKARVAECEKYHWVLMDDGMKPLDVRTMGGSDE